MPGRDLFDRHYDKSRSQVWSTRVDQNSYFSWAEVTFVDPCLDNVSRECNYRWYLRQVYTFWEMKKVSYHYKVRIIVSKLTIYHWICHVINLSDFILEWDSSRDIHVTPVTYWPIKSSPIKNFLSFHWLTHLCVLIGHLTFFILDEIR